MRSRLKRALGGVAAIGLAAAFVPFIAAGPSAATPGAQPDPTLNPNPVATATTPFSFNVSGNAFCDGTGANNWRAHTFIVNDGVNISTLDFTVTGLPAGYVGADFDSTGDGTISAPLHKGTDAGVNLIPAATPAGLVDPSDLAGFTFDPSFWNVADGLYQIGFVCVDGPGTVQQWWSLDVAVDADASPNPFLRIPVVPPTTTTTMAPTTTTTMAPTTTTTTTPPVAAVDHFKCYKVKDLKTPKFVQIPSVSLADQFETKNHKVVKPSALCNPVDKNGEGINDAARHLVCYTAPQAPGQAKFVKQQVQTTNQFGTLQLEATAASELCVSSEKNGQGSEELNDFKCYKVKDLKNPKFVQIPSVSLADQFDTKNHKIVKPATLCNPVDTNGQGIFDANNHMVCYTAPQASQQARFVKPSVVTDNQFGHLGLQATSASTLCVPSTKTLLP
ncbi:MAG: hypothetical protein SGJ13_04955 [Actinomycetota bacterium]|nr:hypothetical protein [Actinomycetota bacterium]